MKKIFLASTVLTFFSLSIILFQISCKKSATAQSSTVCSELATVNITVTIPASKTVYQGTRDDNSVFLYTPFSPSLTTLTCEYSLDMRPMGTAHTMTYSFKNVIPGNYDYGVIFRFPPGSSSGNICNSAVKNINIVAGQTYNLTISSAEFPCP